MDNKLIDKLNKWYEEGIAYHKSIGLDKLPTYVDFYEGKQWPAPTQKTKNLPRPVLNIIEMNGENKKSQILSSPIKLVYQSSSDNINVEKFNKFAEYQLKRLGQEELNDDAILDGIMKGSYCIYYYWDKDIPGLDGLVEGDISAQIIDPSNIIFANPNEKNVQKQDWIMIIS
ncbi:MAG: hypothetical protein IJW82_01155, partial [Clostridia bacterium]|nr:hypothetical protein [Clostridia bacterium]